MAPSMRFKPKKVFVTVGSTSFDELIEAMLECPEDLAISLLKSYGCEQITLQTGKYEAMLKDELRNISDMKIITYQYSKNIDEDIKNADLIIGHAGAGTCIEALRARKRLLVVTNDSLMGGHQDELADTLHEGGYLIKTKLEDFVSGLEQMCNNNLELNEFPPQEASKFEAILDNALMGATKQS